MVNLSTGWRSIRLRWCSRSYIAGPLWCSEICPSLRNRGLSRGKSSGPRRCCGRIFEGNITVKVLADACSLSESHFARCFSLSFRYLCPSVAHQLRDRAGQVSARRNSKISRRDCIALWLLRPGSLYQDFHARRAHESVPVAAIQWCRRQKAPHAVPERHRR